MGVTDPTLLAFDTSGPHIAGAVLHQDAVIAERQIEMARGQAEGLFPLLETLLTEASLTWQDLHGIAVGIGPGNFTGIRISVAAARGLALGLGIPSIGVSNFELLLDPMGPLAEPALLLSLEAPRGQAYVQHFRYGIAQSPPRLIDPSAPPADLELPINMRVMGHHAQQIAAPFHANWHEARPQEIGPRMVRRAEWLLAQAGKALPRPAPLYARAADAAPARDAPPEIVG